MLRAAIDRLRERFQGGGSLSVSDIARDLGVDEGTMRLLVVQLVQMGYIEEECHVPGEDEARPTSCRYCPMGEECDLRDSLGAKIYRPTEKLLSSSDASES